MQPYVTLWTLNARPRLSAHWSRRGAQPNNCCRRAEQHEGLGPLYGDNEAHDEAKNPVAAEDCGQQLQ
jgi:hypothetical protein